MPDSSGCRGRESHLILQRTSRKEVEKGITVVTRGEGVQVYDQDGRAYLDLTAGVTRPVHVGYGRRELAQAAYDQMCRLSYFTPMNFSNPPAENLAETLAELIPGPIDKFLFICDGSEAVDSAVKLAQHYHHFRGDKKRYKVITRRGAYHGVTGLALRSLGTVLPMRHIMEPVAPGGVFVESPYCYRCPYHLEYPACDLHCARDVARIIEFEDPEQVSAFLAEPIQQGFGALAPVREYWPIIREICDRYGVLLIIDEVICGFGRTGRWFGHQHFDLRPDLITMAKGLTSGYIPLGAVGCIDEIMAPIDTFHHLHTYGNHPVSCAVALKNLEIIRAEKLVEKSARMGEYFLAGLRSLAHHPLVGQVRGTGLWTAMDLTSDKKTRAPVHPSRLTNLIERAKSKGLIIKTMGWALEFAPPLIITESDIDLAVKILDQCLTEEEET
ncbi:MAG: aspartate aminotransferase family protein [Thermodesulfobacteriota bacterium]